jgi:hypothetical protein
LVKIKCDGLINNAECSQTIEYYPEANGYGMVISAYLNIRGWIVEEGHHYCCDICHENARPECFGTGEIKGDAESEFVTVGDCLKCGFAEKCFEILDNKEAE